ncbi:MAG TPA: hypothetical protein VN541_14470 [Tepidisphaeraceae bacterium]|nr:hypothetical protein [Tepidisphaeraceae bacterium]
MKTPPTKKGCGGCNIEAVNPDHRKMSPTNPILNVGLTFEEALKLRVAIDEALLRLNSYNRATKAGRERLLWIGVHLRDSTVTVSEGNPVREKPAFPPASATINPANSD